MTVKENTQNRTGEQVVSEQPTIISNSPKSQ